MQVLVMIINYDAINVERTLCLPLTPKTMPYFCTFRYLIEPLRYKYNPFASNN